MGCSFPIFRRESLSRNALMPEHSAWLGHGVAVNLYFADVDSQGLGLGQPAARMVRASAAFSILIAQRHFPGL